MGILFDLRDVFLENNPGIKRELPVLLRDKEKRSTLQTIKRRKANWIGYTFCTNCLLKHVTEGKIDVTGRRERRRMQLLDNLKETRDY
jgi:hypothetical protein